MITLESFPSLIDIVPNTGLPSSARGNGGFPTSFTSNLASNVATNVVTENRARNRPLHMVLPPPNGRHEGLRARALTPSLLLPFVQRSGRNSSVLSPKVSASKCISRCGTKTRLPLHMYLPPITVSDVIRRTEAAHPDMRSVSCQMVSTDGHRDGS